MYRRQPGQQRGRCRWQLLEGSWVRLLTLLQHWVDFAGRKTSAVPAKSKKALVGLVEMVDAPLTQASSRALMAGYADSAANKQVADCAKIRREFGGRIDVLETSDLIY